MVKDGYAVGINENGKREWRVASAYLLGELLGIDVKHQTNATTKHLADVMRTLGWGTSKPIRIGSKQPCRGYAKPIDAPNTQTAQSVEPKAEPAAVVEAVAQSQSKVDVEADAEVVELRRFRLLPL